MCVCVCVCVCVCGGGNVSLFRPNSLESLPIQDQDFQEIHDCFRDQNLADANRMICVVVV